MKDLLLGIRDTAAFAWAAGKLNFILGFTLMMIQPLAMPIAALGLRGIVDDSMAGQARGAVTWGVVVACLATVTLTAEHFAHIFYFKTAEDMAGLINREVASLANGSVGLEHHERADYADRVAYIRRETSRASWSTVSALYGGVAIVVALAFTGFLLATLSPWLLLLPLAAIPPLLLGRQGEVVAKRGRSAGAPATRQANHLFRLLSESGPVKEVRTSGLEHEVRRRQQEAWDEASRYEISGELKAAWLRAAGQIFFAVAYVGATLLVLRNAVRGQATVGDVLMVITLAAQVNTQVTAAVVMLQGLQRTASLFAEMRWVRGIIAGQRAEVEDSPVPTELKHGIGLEGVSFTYPGTTEPVLQDVNLHIPAGATVAIVGENGAGKSTLIKLLCRFYDPNDGTITVDGHDLSRMPVELWRERISAGFQDFARFEFTAQHAVGVGDMPNVDNADAVAAALNRARASDVMRRLGDELGTVLGGSNVNGTDLSGGQWQKLALGRAMMREAPLLLLLDEPTSALDAQAEHNLFEQYALGARRVAQQTGAVTILVSHRFSTVRMADTILVVGDGRIAEAGSHSELVKLGGIYADLYALQAKQYA